MEDYIVKLIGKRIAGDIVLSDNPSNTLKKWREYFEASQAEMAKSMGVSPSVISDYEKGRRMPGAWFIQRYVKSLLEIDRMRGWRKVSSMAMSLGIVPGVVIDMVEFEKPITFEEFVEAVKGVLLNPEVKSSRLVYGYTIVDSINAILSLSGIQFSILFGTTPERAIIFTRVQAGRSPMVAVRVAPVKPNIVVIHGPQSNVDPLAVELARREGIPLILSLAKDVGELKDLLRTVAKRHASQLA